jgi:sugar-specific transcriptional regulator TrmB
MYQEIFENLGLSPNEAKIYESLIGKGESSVSKISVSAQIHRRNAYDAIHRLIDKGLIFEIYSPTETLYNAVDPDKLVELYAEKEQKLKNILPDLKKKFTQRIAPEETYIYRSYEGLKNIWRDILRIGAHVYTLGAKGQWYDPRLETSRMAFFKEANRKKIKFIQLFDYEVKTRLPNFPKQFEGKLQYRFLPKEYSTNSTTNIFGDYVVTYTGVSLGKISESTVFFILHSKDLAESYRTWFWYMWEQSSEK